MSLLPDPKPVALGDADVNAQAGPSGNNKRKHSTTSTPDAEEEGTGASAGPSESFEQHRKRLAAEVQAFRREFGEDALEGDVNAKNDELPVEKENQDAQSSSSSIKVEDGPKNQKIFVELSDDDSITSGPA